MYNKTCSCGKPADTDFSHLKPLCKGCFVELINRRARKALKDTSWPTKGQKVFIEDNPSAKALFKAVIKNLPIEYAPIEQAELVIIGKTADDEAEDFLNQLFEGKLKEKIKAVNILSNITAAELEKYCEFENIAFTKTDKSVLRTKLEALEKRYPGTIFALQKSKDSMA